MGKAQGERRHFLLQAGCHDLQWNMGLPLHGRVEELILESKMRHQLAGELPPQCAKRTRDAIVSDKLQQLVGHQIERVMLAL